MWLYQIIDEGVRPSPLLLVTVDVRREEEIVEAEEQHHRDNGADHNHACVAHFKLFFLP